MSFHIQISTKRDPRERAEVMRAEVRSRPLPPASVATIEVNGALTPENLTALCGRAAEVLKTDVGTAVVDLQMLSGNAGQSLEPLAMWVASQRVTRHHLFVRACQAGVHEILAAMPDAKAWLIAREATEADLSRRCVHIDGPALRGNDRSDCGDL